MGEVKKIQLRGGFSDRNKLQKFNTSMQLKDFDQRTRTIFVNKIRDWMGLENFIRFKEKFLENLIKEVYCEFISPNLEYKIEYKKDEIFATYILTPIMESSYSDVLSLIEYITNYLDECKVTYLDKYWNERRYPFIEDINRVFEQEYVGYRFIDGEITPISDEMEVAEIEQSLDIEFQGCRAHFKKALSFLSDREKPDYKNCIKESISAVESICQIIIGKDSATLGKALKVLEGKGVVLHSALKNAFSSLYGYTSDEGGIRHAEGLFESNVTFEEAKYMLVSCCAFVNYLIAEYGKIK